MKNCKCALCRKDLTSYNDSAEHIIPNAIGGRKKVAGFICQTCNNRSGSMWDAELVQQLNPVSLMLGISRQRGNVPSRKFETYSGGNVRLHADGTRSIAKPEISQTREGENTRLQIKAANQKELRQILKGLSRKHPQLRHRNFDELTATAKDNLTYSSDPMKIDLAFAGKKTGRSLVKSALALVCDAGIEPGHCDFAIDYLLNENKEACYGFYYNRNKDLVTNRPAGIPFHCVYMKGCTKSATVVGYIELFGLWRIVLLLTESYAGNDFSHSYAIDPIEGEELKILVDFDLSVSEIRDAYEYKIFDGDVLQKSIDYVMERAIEIDFKRAMDLAVKIAIDAAIAKSGLKEGDTLTGEQMRDFAGDVAEAMKPFVLHHMTFSDNLPYRTRRGMEDHMPR